jgi:hypothetical protein
LAQQGQCIVTRRSDRKTNVVRSNVQRFEKHIGVFPNLGVPDETKIGAWEEFKEYEDSRPREDKIIHNKVAKPRRENISQQGHKDSPFELLKSVFVAFAILL